jgi:hypothetical protein
MADSVSGGSAGAAVVASGEAGAHAGGGRSVERHHLR